MREEVVSLFRLAHTNRGFLVLLKKTKNKGRFHAALDDSVRLTMCRLSSLPHPLITLLALPPRRRR